jgi:hypothetical protein
VICRRPKDRLIQTSAHAPGIGPSPVGIRPNLEPLYSTPEAAARLGVAEITLRKWRITGFGPRYIKAGSNVRYRGADLESWVNSHAVSSTSEAVRMREGAA